MNNKELETFFSERIDELLKALEHGNIYIGEGGEELVRKTFRDCLEYGYEVAYCTCLISCPRNCKGQCGCKKCHNAYQDFLSEPDV
jgi:hypothetical protein